jgi:hypothetical protein
MLQQVHKKLICAYYHLRKSNERGAVSLDSVRQDVSSLLIISGPGLSSPLVLIPASLPGLSTSSSDIEVDTSTDTLMICSTE